MPKPWLRWYRRCRKVVGFAFLIVIACFLVRGCCEQWRLCKLGSLGAYVWFGKGMCSFRVAPDRDAAEFLKCSSGDLRHFAARYQLGLDLCKSNVSDNDLQYLSDLDKLRRLQLACTPITDAGLEHLRGLTSLESLNLTNTKVTAEGVKKLQQALPNCNIYIHREPPKDERQSPAASAQPSG